MTAIADTAPGQLIRWHYLGYAVLALGVMTVAIASHDHWFLNFVHVICGVAMPQSLQPVSGSRHQVNGSTIGRTASSSRRGSCARRPRRPPKASRSTSRPA